MALCCVRACLSQQVGRSSQPPSGAAPACGPPSHNAARSTPSLVSNQPRPCRPRPGKLMLSGPHTQMQKYYRRSSLSRPRRVGKRMWVMEPVMLGQRAGKIAYPFGRLRAAAGLGGLGARGLTDPALRAMACQTTLSHNQIFMLPLCVCMSFLRFQHPAVFAGAH